jgi:hypothetical protein
MREVELCSGDIGPRLCNLICPVNMVHGDEAVYGVPCLIPQQMMQPKCPKMLVTDCDVTRSFRAVYTCSRSACEFRTLSSWSESRSLGAHFDSQWFRRGPKRTAGSFMHVDDLQMPITPMPRSDR